MVSVERIQLTIDVQRLGSPEVAYSGAAPELYDYDINKDSNEDITYSFRSDVYSVTIVMWEVLSAWLNQRYSIPITGNIYKIMTKVLGGKRPNVSNFPLELVSILEKGWDRDACKRPTIYELLTIVQKLQ